ncbi:hypothetical protein X953_02110 [Virgibacillus sp. SK37]|nr:hypothetical protein X953_02110 [Virgibacillus sp. SK37]
MKFGAALNAPPSRTLLVARARRCAAVHAQEVGVKLSKITRKMN